MDKLNNLKKIDMNCGIFSAYDYEGMTVNEVLCTFFTKINEIIKSQNDTIELVDWLKRIGLKNEVIEKIKELYDDGTLGELINDTLLNNINQTVNDIKNSFISLSYFKKNENENDDTGRLKRGIEYCQENKCVLNIPCENLNISENILLTKPIKIVGGGMDSTIIRGGGFALNSDNITITDLTVDARPNQNGFYANSCKVSNILIENCKSIAVSHSYLFESYNGIVQGINVINCISDTSTHGFISKAVNVNFINCRAINHFGGFGYGLISDNIIGIDKIANCIGSNVIDCSASNCSSGVRLYVRDKFNHVCVPRNNNNSVRGFKFNQCLKGINVGENSIPEGYASIYNIDNLEILNASEISQLVNEKSVIITNVNNIIIDNLYTIGGIEFKDKIYNIKLSNIKEKNKSNVIALNNDNKKLDTTLFNFYEIYLNSNTEDNLKIDLSEYPTNQCVTILIRNGGKNNFGGFNEEKMIIDNSKFNIIKDSIPFNNGQITKWVNTNGLNKKWTCIYASELINLNN